MSRPVERYENNKVIVNHLASQYVLGLLSNRVRQRVDKIIHHNPYGLLRLAISHWEEKMFPLNENTPELPPKATTWNNIKASIDRQEASQPESLLNTRNPVNMLLDLLRQSWLTASLFSFLVIAGVMWNMQTSVKPQSAPLSYVAVLSSNQQPTLVASTYGISRELTVDILDLSPLEKQQDYELWVVSKTDNIARSLGILDATQSSQKRTLSEAEWRLIKDSDSLLLTIEERGGSPFGEPSKDIISKGLCIRLPSGNEDA